MPVILEAFGKRTDVYQVIGLKYNKGRGEYADFVHRNIQQIDLGMPPQNPGGWIGGLNVSPTAPAVKSV